jgi:hypothetical protein
VRVLEAAQSPAAEAGAEGGAAAGAAGGKGKKRARAPAEAAAGAAAGAGAAAAAAKLPPASATFGANPWLAALTDSLTSGASAEAGKGGVTSSGGGAAVNPAAVRAAFQVATWFGRSVKTLEEMIAMAAAPVGPASFAPASSSAAAGAGGPPSPSSAAATAATAGAGAELAADTDLAAALNARRAVCAAWRSYYLALSHVHARRFVDATKLMHRAQTRADEAIEALRLLPGSLKPRDLPARPLYPLVPEHAGAAPRGVVASGVSLADRGAMNELLDAVSQQTVGLQATALLHQLAARCRRDGAFAEGFAKLAPHLAVQRGGGSGAAGAASKATPGSAGTAGGAGAAAAAALPGVLPPRSVSRPTYLPERTSVVGVAEAVTDAEAISPAVPLPVAVPFKPLLLDLAFNYFAYPAGVTRRVPKAELKEGKPAAAGAGTGGAGKAAAAAPSNAPEMGAGWGGGSNAPESPAHSTGAAADAGSSGKGGSGLLGWLTGR